MWTILQSHYWKPPTNPPDQYTAEFYAAVGRVVVALANNPPVKKEQKPQPTMSTSIVDLVSENEEGDDSQKFDPPAHSTAIKDDGAKAEEAKPEWFIHRN